MAFQAISSRTTIPTLPILGAGGLGRTSLLIDAAGEKAAAIVYAPQAGDIAKVGFLTDTVTTGDTVDVRLETVDAATGDPSGALLGTNSNASQVISTGAHDTWFLTTLTTAVTVTRGQQFAVVIANGSGGGNINISNISWDEVNSVYSDLFTASWVKTQTSPIYAFEYSDGSYALSPNVYPIRGFSALSYNSSSDPDERGIKFKLPFPVRAIGAWARLNVDAALDLVLYDNDDSVLKTLSFDKDIRAQAALGTHVVLFDGSEDLTANVFRRLTVKPTTTTNIQIEDMSVDAAVIMDSFEGGQDIHYTQRVDGGDWTDAVKRRPIMGLIYDAFDDGATPIIPRGSNTLLRM